MFVVVPKKTSKTVVVFVNRREENNNLEESNMKSVEELEVFKVAHQLALETYRITKRFPKEETFSLVDQMRRPPLRLA